MVELLCNPRAREPVASFRSVCLTGSVVWGFVSRIAPIDGPRVGLGVGVFLAHWLRLVVI